MAWLHRLVITHNDKISEQSLLSSFSLSMTYRTTTTIQNGLKISSVCTSKPSEILDVSFLLYVYWVLYISHNVTLFQALDKADITYYQHNDRELISNSYSIKSSLWQYYGKPEMSSLWSHLTLYLNIGIKNSKAHYGEPFCLSLCNVAMHLISEGKYNWAYSVIKFVKRR